MLKYFYEERCKTKEEGKMTGRLRAFTSDKQPRRQYRTLSETYEKNDRIYGAGSRLLETKDAQFLYDEEGNLIRKVEENGDMWQ